MHGPRKLLVPRLPPGSLTALVLGFCLVGLPLVARGQAPQHRADGRPADTGTVEEMAVLETDLGTMVIRFFPQDAPRTVAHIQKLIRDGFYDGKPFYRIVDGHVIQTGDEKGGSVPGVELEAVKPHVTGAVGLARGNLANSGTTEIYICHAPRPHLDGKYAVFGQVVEGLEVLDAIGKVPVDKNFLQGNVAFHRPKEPVLIKKASLEQRQVTY